MVKRLLTPAVLILTAASLAWPALASAAKSSCPSSSLCLWQDYAYSGTQWTFSISSWPQDQWDYVGGEANDRASALFNNRVHAALIGQNANPATEGGGIACINPGQSYEDLAEWHWPQNFASANDSVSGFVLYSEVSSCSGDPVLVQIEEEVRPNTNTTESQTQTSG
jgi:hypothetical protein